MATIRMELAVKRVDSTKNVYDCLCETTTDFTTDTKLTTDCGVGSMAYCLADGKVYVKTSTGWGAVE